MIVVSEISNLFIIFFNLFCIRRCLLRFSDEFIPIFFVVTLTTPELLRVNRNKNLNNFSLVQLYKAQDRSDCIIDTKSHPLASQSAACLGLSPMIHFKEKTSCRRIWRSVQLRLSLPPKSLPRVEKVGLKQQHWRLIENIVWIEHFTFVT